MSEEEKKDVQPEEIVEETQPEPAEAKAEAPAEEPKNDAPAEPAEATEEKTEEAPAEEEAEEIPHQNIKAGMVVRVHEKITDVNTKGEEKSRIQVFEGVVLGVRGGGVSRTITVRKDSKGFMVEKIYPLSSPNIDKIEVVKQYRTRRAKLTHLRGNFKRKLTEVQIEK